MGSILDGSPQRPLGIWEPQMRNSTHASSLHEERKHGQWESLSGDQRRGCLQVSKALWISPVQYNVAQSKAHKTHIVSPVLHCGTSQSCVADTKATGSDARRSWSNGTKTVSWLCNAVLQSIHTAVKDDSCLQCVLTSKVSEHWLHKAESELGEKVRCLTWKVSLKWPIA